MWRRLKNIFYSLKTYADLRPDWRTRRRVNRLLRDRPCLSEDQWFERFWQGKDVPPVLAHFIYVQMPVYSGLDFSRVQPGDRLNEDLQLSMTCWFDWQISFCEDFLREFGVDLSHTFNPDSLQTLEDLVLFLRQQVVPMKRS
jgi:hypothetical protein